MIFNVEIYSIKLDGKLKREFDSKFPHLKYEDSAIVYFKFKYRRKDYYAAILEGYTGKAKRLKRDFIELSNNVYVSQLGKYIIVGLLSIASNLNQINYEGALFQEINSSSKVVEQIRRVMIEAEKTNTRYICFLVDPHSQAHYDLLDHFKVEGQNYI